MLERKLRGAMQLPVGIGRSRSHSEWDKKPLEDLKPMVSYESCRVILTASHVVNRGKGWKQKAQLGVYCANTEGRRWDLGQGGGEGFEEWSVVVIPDWIVVPWVCVLVQLMIEGTGQADKS
jgi:hypothetical protein